MAKTFKKAGANAMDVQYIKRRAAEGISASQISTEIHVNEDTVANFMGQTKVAQVAMFTEEEAPVEAAVKTRRRR